MKSPFVTSCVLTFIFLLVLSRLFRPGCQRRGKAPYLILTVARSYAARMELTTRLTDITFSPLHGMEGAVVEMICARSSPRFVLVAGFSLPDWMHTKAEEACDRFEEILGLPVERVRIVVGRTAEEMSRIVGQTIPQGARGLFLGGRHTIVMMEPRNPSEAYVLIAHETTHLLTSEIPNIVALGIPPWFFEGVAIYASEQERLREQIGLPSLLQQAAKLAGRGLLIQPQDPGDLESWVSGRIDEKTIALTMSGGYHLVDWMTQEYGGAVLRDVFLAIREGRSFPEAVEVATGYSLREIAEKWTPTISP